MTGRKIYRIVFFNRGEVYEIFAGKVEQSPMYAFIEVEGIIFGERSQVLVDPSEEKLKNEFSGVHRTHIPIQTVIRIDEVEKAGPGRISAEGADNVTRFPLNMLPPGHSPGKG